MKYTCLLCSGEIISKKGHHPKRASSCLASSIKSPAHKQCWMNSGTQIQKLCVTSVSMLRVRGGRREQAIKLFKELGESAYINDLKQYLKNLTPQERNEILELACDDLGKFLSIQYEREKLDSKPQLKLSEIPIELPNEFRLLLNNYQESLARRYELLLKKKHQRSPFYVRRRMGEPINFCAFLSKSGILYWGEVGNSQIAAYLESSKKLLPIDLKRFIRYANIQKAPFKRPSTVRRRKGGGALIETPRPKIIPPGDLQELINSFRDKLDERDFLWAWLVCKMGLTVVRARNLSLDNVKLNDKNRCVIRPAETWVSLPSEIEKIVIRQISNVYPNWMVAEESQLSRFRLLDGVSDSPTKFSEKHFFGLAKVIRASAIYAMMESGHLDRITLKKTIGVSMPTLAKLERLFSVDVHRKLDPEFIKLRNAYILGEKGE